MKMQMIFLMFVTLDFEINEKANDVLDMLVLGSKC